jgi:hypothetical protein
MCGVDNAFLYFKNNRLEILEDKKAYEVPKEPFHMKMLREEREAEEAKLRKQQELIDEQEATSPFLKKKKKLGVPSNTKQTENS